MQNKPKLRFKEFNNDWEDKSFNDYCLSISSGKSKKRSVNGIYNLYGSTGIIGKIDTVDYNGKYLLVARVGANAGYTYKINDQCGISDNTLVINLRSNLLIDYIYYYLRNWNLNRLVFGSGQPLVTGGMLKKIKVKVPCLDEQKKIAEFLSKVDEVIAEREEEVKDLEQQKKGLMQKIFSQQIRFTDSNNNPYPDWKEKILYDITDVRDGTHDSPKYVSFGYPLVTSKNLTKDGKLDFTDISYITENDYNEINKRSKVHIGDILFGMIGTIGKPVVIQQDNFAIKNVALIKNNNDNINRYLVHYLQSDDILRQFHVEIAGGTQKFIALGLIRNLKILLPCLEEQQKIANVLSKLDELIEEKKALLSDWQQFKKGLLQQMFV